ncbi:MAG: DUF58 domain-containing protein [Methanoculleus sp.]
MMRPTRTAGGVAALTLALTALAIVIESPAAIIAAGSLSIFLLWRAGRFSRNLHALAASLTVSRDVNRTILRQGAEAHVRVRVDLAPPPGMEVRVRDIPPAVAVGTAPLAESGETATYTIRIMAPGRTTFGGVILSARDTYFSYDLHIRHLNKPSLRVFPVRAAEGGGGREGSGMQEFEVDRKANLEGPTVRGFRLYRSGDDPRLIDWKISAKHNVFYVRELTGLEGGTPFIVVDLPTREEGDHETFARYSMIVADAIEGAIESRTGCSLLVIAGGEVTRFLSGTSDVGEAFAALGGLVPVESRAPLYRAPGSAVLSTRARLPGGGEGPEKAYRARLGRVLTGFVRENRSPFGDAVAAALARVEATEVHLYTLARGDASHLAQVIHLARSRGMRVVAKMPRGAPIPPGADAMEAI